MVAPTWDDVASLRDDTGEVRVSVYMPVYRARRENEQNPLRLRNLLDQAAKELEASRLRTPDIAALLKPARDLAVDPLFWSHQDTGLAIFLKPGEMRTFAVPFAVPELSIGGGRFHVRPLVTGLQLDQPYYLLGLGRRNPRLWRGDRFGLEELKLTNPPGSLDDLLTMIESKERQVQVRTGARMGDRSSVIYHGHGGGSDDDDERLLEYFRILDAAVMHVLREEHRPLLLAGIHHLLPLYRSVTRYGHVMERALEINADSLGERELHARTWELVRPLAAVRADEECARYEVAEGRGEAVHSIVAVLPATLRGEIAVLLVADGEYRWGVTDAVTESVSVHEERRPGDEELIDRAIAETLAKGGEVYALPVERMPHGAEVAALLRY